MYNSMSFDKHVHSYSHHYNQDVEHFHYPEAGLCHCVAILSLDFEPLATTDLFFVPKGLLLQSVT